jgi:hypothetical protein
LIVALARGMRTAPVRYPRGHAMDCVVQQLTFGLTVLESYITHIRIIEDAAYPSSPPPPTANPDAKKPRLIIVAVRKSGRVRMHKARENVNGTFSIGKTWPLDDLSAVKIYTAITPANAEEEQQKQWAGSIGFTVTLGKPYYWQANSSKEKQFFIASLVKIYTKYTGGKTPELIGFDTKEREGLQGAAAGATPSSQQSGRPGAVYGQTPQNRPPPRQEPPRERPLRNQPSRDAVQRPQPQPPTSTPSLTSQTSRPQMRGSPSGSIDSNGGGPQQQNLRRVAGANQSQESFGSRDDGASLPPRSRGGMNGLPNAPGRFQDRSITPNSLRAVTPDSSFPNSKDTADGVPPVPAPLTFPPERRRPPMPIIGDSRQRGQNSAENIVPAPLSSPGMRREDLRPPTRSSERTQPREREPVSKINDAPFDTNGSSRDADESADPSIPSQSFPSTTSPPVQMPEEPKEPEIDNRPGLGPMIKKKSRGDIAGQFMKAAKTANAFNSFKPRAGGAADRLRETQTKSSDGPDGITSVVPAPSLVRGMSGENSSLLTPPVSTSSDKMMSPRKSHDSIPEVKITVPQSGRPSSVEGPLPAAQDKAKTEKSQTREVKRIKSPAETMAKELASLGIDPAILGGRGGELVAAWEEFGWVGDGIRTKNIDQMKDEVERELNKVQAGGWLKMLDEEDERIEAIKQGLDKCIEECDELDGLLTLYSVELSVRLPVTISQLLLTD